MCNSRLVASTGIPQTARQASRFKSASVARLVRYKCSFRDAYSHFNYFQLTQVFSNLMFLLSRCIMMYLDVHCSPTSATSGAFTVPRVPAVPAVPEPLFGADLPGSGHIIQSKERHLTETCQNSQATMLEGIKCWRK